MQTDDLAAQMVREICGHVLIDPPGIFDGKKPSVKFEVKKMEAIASRYIEKAVATVSADAFHDGYHAGKIDAERAGKEPPHER